jgi:hypothetical protein
VEKRRTPFYTIFRMADKVAAVLGAYHAAKGAYSKGKKVVSTAHKVGKAIKKHKVVKKAGHHIVHGAKVGKAAVQLASRLANPINQVKFAAKAAKGEGFVLPGSKYIGPGNRMDLGAPVDVADANAYQHDIDYDNYIKSGIPKHKVYLGYSDADKRLQEKTPWTTPNGLAVQLGMGIKQLANAAHLTPYVKDEDQYPSVQTDKATRAISVPRKRHHPHSHHYIRMRNKHFGSPW